MPPALLSFRDREDSDITAAQVEYSIIGLFSWPIAPHKIATKATFWNWRPLTIGLNITVTRFVLKNHLALRIDQTLDFYQI